MIRRFALTLFTLLLSKALFAAPGVANNLIHHGLVTGTPVAMKTKHELVTYRKNLPDQWVFRDLGQYEDWDVERGINNVQIDHFLFSVERVEAQRVRLKVTSTRTPDRSLVREVELQAPFDDNFASYLKIPVYTVLKGRPEKPGGLPEYRLVVACHNGYQYFRLSGDFSKGELEVGFMGTSPKSVGRPVAELMRLPTPHYSTTHLAPHDGVVAILGNDGNFVRMEVLGFNPVGEVPHHQDLFFTNEDRWVGDQHVAAISATSYWDVNGALAYAVMLGVRNFDHFLNTYLSGHTMTYRMHVEYDPNRPHPLSLSRDPAPLKIKHHNSAMKLETGHFIGLVYENRGEYLEQKLYDLHFWRNILRAEGDAGVQGIVDTHPDRVTQAGLSPTPVEDVDGAQGMIVMGMVLSTPPTFGQVTKDEDLLGYGVTTRKGLTATLTKDWVFSAKNVSGLTLGSLAAAEDPGDGLEISASLELFWSGGIKEESSRELQTTLPLNNPHYNQIIGIKPAVQIHAGIMTGHDRGGLYYINRPEAKHPVAAYTPVVNPERSRYLSFKGNVTKPGFSGTTEGAPLRLTQGMIDYFPVLPHPEPKNKPTQQQLNYHAILTNLERYAHPDGPIKRISAEGAKTMATALLPEISTSQANSVQFGLTKAEGGHREDNQSFSLGFKFGTQGAGHISNVSTTGKSFKAKNKLSDNDHWELSYGNTLQKSPPHVGVSPVIYQIDVPRLKVDEGERDPTKGRNNKDLRFIPDYMWENDQNYWLLAYEQAGVRD